MRGFIQKGFIRLSPLQRFQNFWQTWLQNRGRAISRNFATSRPRFEIQVMTSLLHSHFKGGSWWLKF